MFPGPPAMGPGKLVSTWTHVTTRCYWTSPPPPPPLNTTYHLRGGPEYHLPLQKPLSHKSKTAFAQFDHLSSESIFGQTNMNFEKPREIFLCNGMKNKNLSQFFHRFHEQGESKPSSRPFFPVFHFSVTILILRELLRRAGGEFGETEGGFCPAHAHIQ